MAVARLKPLALNKWGPLVIALTEAIYLMRHSQIGQFRLVLYSGAPNPFVSFETEAHRIRVVISLGGVQTGKSKERGDFLLRTTGFIAENSNDFAYSRHFRHSYSGELLSKLVLDLCLTSGLLDANTYFQFDGGSLVTTLAETDAFWHYKANPAILCLPGSNWSDTLEGLTEPPF